MPWADEWGAVIGIEEGDAGESGDVVHDAAGGVRGVVESVQRAGGHCCGDADCESAGDAVGGADRVLREHAGDAGEIAWGDELPGVVGGGEEDSARGIPASGRAVRATGGGTGSSAESEYDAGIPSVVCVAERAA